MFQWHSFKCFRSIFAYRLLRADTVALYIPTAQLELQLQLLGSRGCRMNEMYTYENNQILMWTTQRRSETISNTIVRFNIMLILFLSKWFPTASINFHFSKCPILLAFYPTTILSLYFFAKRSLLLPRYEEPHPTREWILISVSQSIISTWLVICLGASTWCNASWKSHSSRKFLRRVYCS